MRSSHRLKSLINPQGDPLLYVASSKHALKHNFDAILFGAYDKLIIKWRQQRMNFTDVLAQPCLDPGRFVFLKNLFVVRGNSHVCDVIRFYYTRGSLIFANGSAHAPFVNWKYKIYISTFRGTRWSGLNTFMPPFEMLIADCLDQLGLQFLVLLLLFSIFWLNMKD